ncbi:MAG TPA: aminopeptidase N [Hyphomicrobiaceae bacterium]|nr:aminopeptidase N [Hyphomicrobiaceae bacterium]
MKTDTPRPIRLKNYQPPDYLIDKVDLDIQLHPTRTRIRARLNLRPNPAVTAHGPLRLDGEQLELDQIHLDGQDLKLRTDYDLSDTSLTLKSPPQKPFRLEIITYVDPDANKALQGLYRSRGIYCTQCEAHGFRRITYFLDRPDVLSTYNVRMEADAQEAPVLLSNGNPVERGTLQRGKRHYAIWHDPHPKPCYLFALVGGDLSSIASTFKTMSGRKVDLGIYVEHGKEERAAWAMDCLKRSMRWDEKRFGREYDLDVFNIVAVSDFNMGAMENKGLNIFNDRLILASPQTATDTMFEAIESVVAHEYFHNWTGNRITCRDWFQLCLKEGLTVYRDQEFSGDERSPTVQRITDVRQLKTHQFPEDAGPLAHSVRPSSYIEINNFYTATVYEKGAELVRMLHTILGDDAFRAGMDLYFERHDGDAATVEDFIACFAQASGRDLGQFMTWYEQAGTPQLVCAISYDKRNKTAELKVEQVLPATPGETRKKPFHIPLRLGLIGDNGHDLDLVLDTGERISNGVIHITKRSETFRFLDIPSRPCPSLLRGFSAPVNLTLDSTDRDLEFLMANDADLFNRWQAANTYATRTLIHIVKALKEGRRSTRGIAYARALGTTIANTTLEPAYRAELLKLPTQSDIAREIGQDVDPGFIHRAHRQLSRLLVKTLTSELKAIYKQMTTDAPFAADAHSAGCRALRNAVLSLLVARGERADILLATRHFEHATNMTDEAHALYLLAATSGNARDKALNRFFERWKHDHLVIDTWFTAQAVSPLPGTIKRVQELAAHPLFAITTPNKVRALVGNFATLNPVQFNRTDGEGYAFVADQILAIDRFNPQIAARILGAFRSWHALEPVRKRQARKALTKVAGTPNLSRDVYEIVSRILEG